MMAFKFQSWERRKNRSNNIKREKERRKKKRERDRMGIKEQTICFWL
jgi:hypothetical protein